jgi:hypothetical protein
LPAELLRQLIRENAEDLQRCSETDGGEIDLRVYFAASALDVNRDGALDLIVQPEKYCLQGAHNTVFWVFVKTGRGSAAKYQRVFTVRNDWMDVLKTTSHGFRDIRAAGHTAVEMHSIVWRHDGRRYRPAVCTTENLETNKSVRVKCAPD